MSFFGGMIADVQFSSGTMCKSGFFVAFWVSFEKLIELYGSLSILYKKNSTSSQFSNSIIGHVVPLGSHRTELRTVKMLLYE